MPRFVTLEGSVTDFQVTTQGKEAFVVRHILVSMRTYHPIKSQICRK